MKNPKISVVIPARNEEEDIVDTLNAVAKQEYPNKEVIVVNDGSTDKTQKLVEDFSKKHKYVKLINYEKGHSAAFARNRGAENAKGEIIVFLDADTGINEGFLKYIAEDFSDFDVQAVGNGKQNTYTNLLSHLLALLAYTPKKSRMGKKRRLVNEFVGFNAFVIKRKPFIKIGGFNEKVFYYEDEEMTRRFFSNGFKAVWDPRPLFYSLQPSTWKGFYRQYAWSGKGIATIKNKKLRRKRSIYCLIKVLFVFFPFLLMAFSLKLGISALLAFYAITYFYALRASKNAILSFLIVPIMYIKNIFELYNLIKFTILKKNEKS